MDSDRIDWAKKGLGWIPDLPDINRNFNKSDLNKTSKNEDPGNLHGDEAAYSIAQLTQQLISLVDVLKEKKLIEKSPLEDQQLTDLKNQLGDNIDFKDVQVFPYRQISYSARKMLWALTKFEEFESDQSKFIESLLNELVDGSFNVENLKDKVAAFQESENLLPDGFIGPLTYSRLRSKYQSLKLKEIFEKFRTEGDRSLLDESEQFTEQSPSPNVSENKQSSTVEPYIDYYQIPLIINNNILDCCFDNLRLAWFLSKFAEKERKIIKNKKLSKNENREKDEVLIEEKVIEKIAVLELCFLDFYQQISDDIVYILKGKIKKEKIINFLKEKHLEFERYLDREVLDTFLIAKFKSISKAIITDFIESVEKKGLEVFFIGRTYQDFRNAFYECFYIIEPLVTAFYLAASPFSAYANSGQAVEFGFDRLYSYFRPKFLEIAATYVPLARLSKLYSGQDYLKTYKEANQQRFLVKQLVDNALAKLARQVYDFEKKVNEFDEKIVEVNNNDIEGITLSKLQKLKEKLSKLKEELYLLKANFPEQDGSRTGNKRKVEQKDEDLLNKIDADIDFLQFIKDIFYPFVGSIDLDKCLRIQSSRIYDKPEIFSISDRADGQNNASKQEGLVPITRKLEKPFKVPIKVESINRIGIKKEESFVIAANKEYKCYCTLPNVIDLSLGCSPIRDQGVLNSCTAISGIALVEYWSRQSFGKHTDLSSLFLYKVARELIYRSGDTGTSIQATMQAIILFGVPPEECWPYREEFFDDEPPAFCYSYAQNYQALKYFRLDSALTYSSQEFLFDAESTSEATRQLLLFKVKATLAAGLPCMFGLTLYNSVYEEQNTSRGHIPCPNETDQIIGGHTLVAVGYNDYKIVEQANEKSSVRGAILVRNSWGTEWGQKGYGWLPYDYILKGLTADWWSLVKAESFDRETLGLGVRKPGGDNSCNGSSCKL